MKIYIMYEVSGAMGHIDPRTQDNPETSHAVTAEVNAVIAGATKAGATEFLVNTGYPWNWSQIIPQDLDPCAELIRGGVSQTRLWKDSTKPLMRCLSSVCTQKRIHHELSLFIHGLWQSTTIG